tara:strand:+ start:1062 stop:1634 length:573 start_codon:yes stop_codon:yes gene_type:complete
MNELLRQYLIEQVSSPKEEDIEGVLSIFEVKEFKKGDYFKEPFKAGKEIGFLVSGAIRIIVFKDDGQEVTARIREENSFIADPYMLENDKPSPIGIECLENLSLLVADMTDFQNLLETNLTLNIVVRKFLSQQIREIGKQQLLFLTGSAKERYEFIIKQHPNLLKKFPLRFIASMIGITPTQLSRVRKKK